VTANARRTSDIAPAIEALNNHADALYVVSDPLLASNYVRINTVALNARLPTMYGYRDVDACRISAISISLPVALAA
jgi:ABC-type uncharacterized transport system substrate-binding protein